MAKHVLGPDSTVTVNGTDLSQWVTNVTVEDSAEEVDVTGFSEDFREYTRGLRDMSVTVTFLQDYAAGGPDATIQPLYDGDLAGTVKVNPQVTGGTVVYTAVSKPYGWSPVSGAVGAANSIDVTFRNASTLGLTRGTS
jgi:hypothetical protein